MCKLDKWYTAALLKRTKIDIMNDKINHIFIGTPGRGYYPQSRALYTQIIIVTTSALFCLAALCCGPGVGHCEPYSSTEIRRIIYNYAWRSVFLIYVAFVWKRRVYFPFMTYILRMVEVLVSY